jgi:PAS domain-containing protein
MNLSAPDHIAVQETRERQLKHDPLLLAIIGTAIGLTILVAGIAGFWGSGPVLVNAAPIRDAQGKTVAAINTWLDITDRKRAEEVLRESDALYRAMARSIPGGGLFVVDKNLRYLIAEGTVTENLDFHGKTLQVIQFQRYSMKTWLPEWRHASAVLLQERSSVMRPNTMDVSIGHSMRSWTMPWDM